MDPPKEIETTHPFRGENNPLSNLFLVTEGVTYDNKHYPSVEHAYKSQEAIYKEREDLVPVIADLPRGLDAMRMVNDAVKGVENEEWTLNRVSIMKTLLEDKFTCSNAFRETLLSSTGILVEATTNQYWGSGLKGIIPTKETLSSKWPGQNKMGKLLTEMRDAKQAELTTAAEPKASTTSPATSVSVIDTIQEEDEEEMEPVLYSEIHTATVTGTTVILSDSMLCNATPSANLMIQGQSGASLDAVPSLLHQAALATEGQIGNIVIAIGVVDVMNNESVCPVNVSINKAVDQASVLFPDTQVILSAILPRKGKGQAIADCNRRIKEVNNYMKEYSNYRSNLEFVSHHQSFATATENMYRDTHGLHLSQHGMDTVIKNIEDFVGKKCSTPLRCKRIRSVGTPPSAEKPQKVTKK